MNEAETMQADRLIVSLAVEVVIKDGHPTVFIGSLLSRVPSYALTSRSRFVRWFGEQLGPLVPYEELEPFAS